MKTVNVKSLGDCPYLISLEPEDFIGHGSYAQVCRSYNKHAPEEKLAAKIFDLSDARKFQSALKELKFVSDLPRHCNLVQCKRVKISSKNRVYIIMELCESNLKSKINQAKQGFKEEEIWSFLSQFCEGYKVLYNKKIIHRDIKPDNILIGFDKNYKIADLGLAEVISALQQKSKVKGSLCYLAPELLSLNGHVSNMNDVYSLGVTVYQMCFKKLPYVKNIECVHTINKFIQQVKNSNLSFPAHNYSPKLLNLIQSMLEKQPSKRCTWQYIFFILTSIPITPIKQINSFQSSVDQKQGKNKKFRIVQISDAMLKNLSNLDTELYQSLSNQSLLVIDHIEADLISKRQVIYFCDRLQYRIHIILTKVNSKALQKFGFLLLQYTYFLSKHLDQYFQKYYEKIEKSQFLKILASQKYTFLRNLVKEDHLALRNLVQEGRERNNQKSQHQHELHSSNRQKNIQADLYGGCFQTILALYRLNLLQECKEVDELQKWLERKEKSEGLLSKLRKNENALKQFDQNTAELTRDKLKEVMPKTYIYSLNKIDKEDKRS